MNQIKHLFVRAVLLLAYAIILQGLWRTAAALVQCRNKPPALAHTLSLIHIYAAILDGEFPLGKLLSGLLGLEDDEEETDVRGKVVCPTCGTSFDDFVENSRFGCPDCYGVFDLFISDKMKQLQGSGNHKGKHPKFRSTFEKEHPAQANAGETKETADSAAIQENGMDSRSAAVNKQIRELETRLKDCLLYTSRCV